MIFCDPPSITADGEAESAPFILPLLQEKSAIEAQVQAEIDKLDKAKAMDLISQDEYDAKVSKLRKRVDNFEAIKKAEQKCAMGITTEAEKEAEIAALLSD